MCCALTLSQCNVLKVEDILITVPWGHIAGKWWGSKSVRPILCIHGWQDNCGSFDPLIMQLPDHISYLAIDFPGHGHSSRIPHGMIYSLETYFYSVMLVCDHFRWEKVSLLGHSLGSIVSFLFASAFPNKCDMVIALDTLRPYNDIFKLIHRHFSKGLQKSVDADVNNRQNREPPAYTYDELLGKTRSGIFLQVDDKSAPYLLQRAVLPSAIHSNKYYFARDNRMKSTPIPMMAHDVTVMFAKNISSPYCFLKSSVRPMVENEELYNGIVQIMSKNPNFEIHSVGGNHHVHLNEPEKVSGIVSKFINKYKPRQVVSKL